MHLRISLLRKLKVGSNPDIRSHGQNFSSDPLDYFHHPSVIVLTSLRSQLIVLETGKWQT